MSLDRILGFTFAFIFMTTSKALANDACTRAYAMDADNFLRQLGRVLPTPFNTENPSISDYTYRFLKVMAMDPVIASQMAAAHVTRQIEFKDVTPLRVLADKSQLVVIANQILWMRKPVDKGVRLLAQSNLQEDPPNEAFVFSHMNLAGHEQESGIKALKGATCTHADWCPALEELLSEAVGATRYWEKDHTHLLNEVGYFGLDGTPLILFHQTLGRADLDFGADLSKVLPGPFVMTATVPSGLRYSAVFVNGEDVTDRFDDYLN